MKNRIFLMCFLLLCFSVQAQNVSNIRAEQRGQDIVVLYSLDSTSPCEVSLLLSQDNGVIWGSPLKNVSGDVGKNISAGEKQITWKVLEEKEYLVGDKMKFKVIANGRKSFEPEMVFVEGGTFYMGSNLGDIDEKPIHAVTLDSYSIGKYEVTQAQWKAVMGNYATDHKACDKFPTNYATSQDVSDFINKLNSLTGKNYRLPTEAEWEFAARGGNLSKGYTYSGSNDINEVAWFGDNSEKTLHFVGTKQCNELGIHDMSGNVWEWCSDWYGEYSRKSQNNPIGPSKGNGRVLRGGCSVGLANNCRSTNRMSYNFEVRDTYAGFRLVLP